MTTPTPWIKAAASGQNSGCVELRRNGEKIELRDSKNPDGPVLEYTAFELECFLDGARKGEFDHLV